MNAVAKEMVSKDRCIAMMNRICLRDILVDRTLNRRLDTEHLAESASELHKKITADAVKSGLMAEADGGALQIEKAEFSSLTKDLERMHSPLNIDNQNVVENAAYIVKRVAADLEPFKNGNLMVAAVLANDYAVENGMAIEFKEMNFSHLQKATEMAKEGEFEALTNLIESKATPLLQNAIDPNVTDDADAKFAQFDIAETEEEQLKNKGQQWATRSPGM